MRGTALQRGVYIPDGLAILWQAHLKFENSGFRSGSAIFSSSAFPTVLGCVSGVIVIIAAGITLAMLITQSYLFGGANQIPQFQQLFRGGERAWFAEAISIVLILAGVAILIGSLLLLRRPDQSEKWGYLILMGAVTSLFWIGGFLIGPILGIISGVVAIYRSKRRLASS